MSIDTQFSVYLNAIDTIRNIAIVIFPELVGFILTDLVFDTIVLNSYQFGILFKYLDLHNIKNLKV